MSFGSRLDVPIDNVFRQNESVYKGYPTEHGEGSQDEFNRFRPLSSKSLEEIHQEFIRINIMFNMISRQLILKDEPKTFEKKTKRWSKWASKLRDEL